MKMREKYKDKILVRASDGYFHKEIMRKLVLPFYGISKTDGAFEDFTLFAMWLDEEYIEAETGSEIDWSKVAMDTPILVRDSKKDAWRERHFAGHVYDRIYTWEDGRTSWTCHLTEHWNYAKIAESSYTECWDYAELAK